MQYEQGVTQVAAVGYPNTGNVVPQASSAFSPSLYPSLGDYMGLQLTPEFVQQNMPLVAASYPQVCTMLSGHVVVNGWNRKRETPLKKSRFYYVLEIGQQ